MLSIKKFFLKFFHKVCKLYFSYLIDLSSDELFVSAIIFRRHEMFDDVNQKPKGVLFVHEKQGDGCYPVETL